MSELLSIKQKQYRLKYSRYLWFALTHVAIKSLIMYLDVKMPVKERKKSERISNIIACAA